MKANVKVGDMILAINSNSLLFCTQREACDILMRLRGGAATATFLLITPSEEVAARRVMSLPRPKSAICKKKSNASSGYSDDSSMVTTRATSSAETATETEERIEIWRDLTAADGGGDILGIDVTLDTNRVVISEIAVGGLAERDGRLRLGDVILSMNGIELRGNTLHETKNLLLVEKEKVLLCMCIEGLF